MSDCQQDPLKTGGGACVSVGNSALSWSHLSLPDSSISALKEETDTLNNELKVLQHIERNCMRKPHTRLLPLAQGRQTINCGVTAVAVFPLATWWAVPTFAVLPHLAKLSDALSPRKPSDVDSGPTTGVNSQDLGFIHVCNTYLLNEWLCHGQSSCYGEEPLLERCLIKIWEGRGNTTL